MHPSVPRPIRAVLVLATIASLLAIPSLATAAPKGSDVTFSVSPLMDAVSPEMDAAYEVHVRNDGSANLTHATLTMTFTGATAKNVPAGCSGVPVVCGLGTLVSGADETLVFVATAAKDVTSIDVAGRLQVDAGGGNPSEDEFTDDSQNVIPVETSQSLFTTWRGLNEAFDAPVAGGGQTTNVHVPGVGDPYVGSVVQSDVEICGIDGIGQGVSMALAHGDDVDPFITLTITYDASARENRTPGNVNVVHDSDCEPLTKGCLTAGCFNAWWEGSGRNKILVVEALLEHNGIVKGF